VDDRSPVMRILPGATCLALYFLFRLPHLTSIPPYTFDEGLFGLVAKNWVTSHDPFHGGNLNLLRFPLYSTVLAAAHAVFGSSILVSRGISILAGAISFFLLTRIAGRLLSSRSAPWVGLLFAVDFILVRYQRYGLAESLQILLLLATVWMWIRPDRRGPWWCGLLLALAVLQKPTSLYLVPALLWWDRNRWKARGLVPYLSAAALVAAVFAALSLGWPEAFVEAWGIYARGHPSFTDLPRTLAILLAGSPVAVLGSLSLFARRRVTDRGERFIVVWLLSGFLFLVLLRNHPVRFFATLLPPAMLAGAILIGSLRDRGWPRALCVALILVHAVAAYVGYSHILGHGNATGPAVARWCRSHVAEDAVILGPAHLGVDLPQTYFDYTSLGALALSDSLLDTYAIDCVLYDDVEWRSLSESRGLGVREFLTRSGRLETKIGDAEVWRINR